MLCPGVEVSADINTASDAVVLANRPVLLEGGCTLDRRLVVTCGLEDLIGASVDVDGAYNLRCTAGVIGSESLDNVVLDLLGVSILMCSGPVSKC